MKIAVYTVCLNEAAYVNTWMEAAEAADLILVCDTGSTDETLELLRWWESQYPDKIKIYSIVVKPWRFDVARNTSLSLLPADIEVCACIDLDEILQPRWREGIEAEWKDGVTRIDFLYHWNFKPDGTPGTTFYRDRIHKRTNYVWRMPTHEYPAPYLIDSKAVQSDNIVVHHHQDLSKERTNRDVELLELALLENPEQDRSTHYLARQYVFVGNYEKAIQQFEKHLAMPTATWDAERCSSWRFMAQCWEKMGVQQKREKSLLRAVEECASMREPWIDLAKYYYDHEQWDVAYGFIKRALRIQKAPPVYMTEMDYYEGYPHDLLSVCAWNLGLKEEALKNAETALRFKPEDERIRTNVKLMSAASAVCGLEQD